MSATSMQLDHEALARDLVRSLRGSRSQVAFSRRLGYATNTVYSWEAGRRWPTAARFLWAARRSGLSVESALTTFYRRDPAWLDRFDPTEPEGVVALLADLRGDQPVTSIAAWCGRSRFAVARWLKGQAEPRLPDFLRLIDAMSLRLLDFTAAFADPATLRSVDEEWAQLQSARTLAWSTPWAQGVLLALQLSGYTALAAHDDAWIAAQLGIDASEVHTAIEKLVQTGQIERRGAHYTPVAIQAVDLRLPGSGQRLKAHWAQVGAQRLGQGGMYSYNLFTIAASDLERLREMQRAYYRSVRALVHASPSADAVVLMNLQLVPLGIPPE